MLNKTNWDDIEEMEDYSYEIKPEYYTKEKHENKNHNSVNPLEFYDLCE